MDLGRVITENHFIFLRMQKIIIKFNIFFHVKEEGSLRKLVTKESLLNLLKGIYKYLIANMVLTIEILKAKHLR